jgi:hypothetical protein
MDPFSPIAGISLERYAELGAAISHCPNDPAEQVRVVGDLGVSQADWEQASQGWLARMQDMALMGRVATAYMPLYQAALARKNGVVEASYNDFVAMSAAAKALGIERMLASYQTDMATWTQVAGHWNTQIAANQMAYMQHNPMIEQEAARIQAGGQLRPVTLQKKVGGGAPAAPGAMGALSPEAAAQQYQNQMMAQAVQANVASQIASAQGQAAAAYGQAAANVGFLGQAVLGAYGLGAIANGIGPGMAVNVRWPDGNQYPGQVTQVGGGQVLVAFSNGQQQWVPANAVTAR